jgi:hypothetical protein
MFRSLIERFFRKEIGSRRQCLAYIRRCQLSKSAP